MYEKKYLNISEVSKIVDLKEHVIRYWDSVDPITNEIRITGLSTRSKGGTRYFNKENIKKLTNLKNILFNNGKHNYSLDLAKKLLEKRKVQNIKSDVKLDNNSNLNLNTEKLEKLNKILRKMRLVLNNY